MHYLPAKTSTPQPLLASWSLRLTVLVLALALLGGCRASGPGTPARTVAAFFDKYGKRSGFHTAEWSAGFLQRLALVQAAKLLGSSDITNAITGIRTARVLSFVPTSSSARTLVREGLSSEVSNLLAAERYTSLSSANGTGAYNYVVKANGDQVSEVVATGTLPDALDSFVLVQVQGSFTRTQAEALARVLPKVVQQTSGQ